ncbi:MAG: TVP38/TMEM64 family protein [Pseudomonadota bacterium]
MNETISASKPLWQRLLPVGVVVALLGTAYATGLTDYFSVEALQANKAAIDAYVASNFLLATVIYFAVYTVAVSVSFPGASFLTLAGGAIFGWFWGGTITVFAATAGASIIFLIAKSALGDTLEQKAGKRLSKLREGFQADAFNYLLTLRIAPVVPFWITNIAPALFGMDLKRYVIATFMGIIPGTYAYAFIGQQVGAAVGADGGGVVKAVALGLGALAVASVIPLIWKRIRKSRTN